MTNNEKQENLAIKAHNLTNTKSLSQVTNRLTTTNIMKTTCAFLAICLATSQAFTAQSSSVQRLAPLNAYVPAGLSADEYRKIKDADKKKLGNNLGGLGPRGFKSRSMQSWQEAYERGETGHSMVPFGYRKALKNGEIKKEDVPYMVRGGSWDNSDVFGAKRKRWLKSDKEYARGGYKKEQSASILGGGAGFDWAGTRSREENLKSKLVPGLS
jgi:hypothetical protein